ncbi:hypothetical protein OG601_15665 [Streptomyces sp. NBC_01239]|uniref:hypothetical protein n=1 Tax=Streptomyces sp. NBC_01239 TaxID=2903792 RepID=UPI002259DE35|nr:hypothetical protein [Streptomyces sp. NBC_01239]MCX4812044.1 hypothetical protein [Streptomyces sp. NBC_01239]
MQRAGRPAHLVSRQGAPGASAVKADGGDDSAGCLHQLCLEENGFGEGRHQEVTVRVRQGIEHHPHIGHILTVSTPRTPTRRR